MLKLIKLEMRKNKSNLLKGVLIADLAILLFMVLVIFTSVREDGDFSTYADVFEGVHTFVKAAFIIFASVLISKLVIDEYKNNTITVLFMYPVSRKKLMAAKLIIVFLFTILSIFLSDLLLGMTIAGIDHYFSDVIQGELTLKMFSSEVIDSALDALYAAGIALIPVYFGMRKKSVPNTIVSAVLIVMLISSGTDGFRAGNLFAVSAGLSLLGVCIAYLSIRNIEHQDIA